MNGRRHDLRSVEQGCSLVEALVALSILSFVLAGTLGSFTLTEEGIAAGAKSMAMTALVENKIQALQATPYNSLLSSDPDAEGKTDTVFQETSSGQFQAQQTIQGVLVTSTVVLDHAVLGRSGVATIKVSAEWNDPRGRHRTVRFGLRRANPVYSGGMQ
jgi:hypothetical protein